MEGALATKTDSNLEFSRLNRSTDRMGSGFGPEPPKMSTSSPHRWAWWPILEYPGHLTGSDWDTMFEFLSSILNNDLESKPEEGIIDWTLFEDLTLLLTLMFLPSNIFLFSFPLVKVLHSTRTRGGRILSAWVWLPSEGNLWVFLNPTLFKIQKNWPMHKIWGKVSFECQKSSQWFANLFLLIEDDREFIDHIYP